MCYAKGRERGYAKEPPARWRRSWRRPTSSSARYWEAERHKQCHANPMWGFNRPHQQWQQGAAQRYDRNGEFGGCARGRNEQTRKQQPREHRRSTMHSKQQHNFRPQATGPANHKTKQQGESFSVFVDGLRDRITLQKLRAIFGKAWRLHDVFIQQKKKYQRRFRFGFVRFNSNDEAWKAIRMFYGLRLEGNYLVVQKARFQRPVRAPAVPSPGKNRYEIQGRVWRPQEQQQDSEHVPVQVKNESAVAIQTSDACQLRLAASEVDEDWVQRCARARTLFDIPVNVLQEQFSQIGLFNFRLIPLGANEVILEFETREEMQVTLEECDYFLEQKLSDLKPCTAFTFGVAQLVWIRLWQVPMGL